MRSATNVTIVTARLLRYAAAADGQGGDIEFEVIANESPAAQSDFLRSAPHETVRAFYPDFSAQRLAPLVGKTVRIEMTFLGGPSGGRPVVRSISGQ